ncbi:hypothetical protein [Candidatus Uabimicrobium sp. HlEnr_7]|uniref:hypothetical protein n=1 Tax=Candidatus Uabimicrobium helgolandensis TaxID=3095367 RepID=UPI0035578668
MSSRLYEYVGPRAIAENKKTCERVQVTCHEDIVKWTHHSKGIIITTFIVDEQEKLWAADRHCEHVACARRNSVFAAGEMTFALDRAEVTFITNQSTGYCPEVSSWNVISDVLAKTNMIFPSFFDKSFIFRRCVSCQQINIVKDDIYECAVCETSLNLEWNF